jgi:hypothetical protein
MMQQAYAAWKKGVTRVPPHVIIAVAVILILLVIGVVIQAIRVAQKPDINSPNIFSQVKPDQPLVVVTASQVVNYLKGHKLDLTSVKPYSSSRLKPAEAYIFNVQGQAAIILSYTDTSAMIADRTLFESEAQNMPAKSNNPAATIIAPTAKPTSGAVARWNMDDVGNVILLTDKTMSADIRAGLVSHLYSLIVAPVRAGYPTPTP